MCIALIVNSIGVLALVVSSRILESALRNHRAPWLTALPARQQAASPWLAASPARKQAVSPWLTALAAWQQAASPWPTSALAGQHAYLPALEPAPSGRHAAPPCPTAETARPCKVMGLRFDCDGRAIAIDGRATGGDELVSAARHAVPVQADDYFALALWEIIIAYCAMGYYTCVFIGILDW